MKNNQQLAWPPVSSVDPERAEEERLYWLEPADCRRDDQMVVVVVRKMSLNVCSVQTRLKLAIHVWPPMDIECPLTIRMARVSDPFHLLSIWFILQFIDFP